MVLKAGLCSCFDNIHVCCSVMFCSPCTVAQALQIGCGKTVGAQGCRIVAGVLIALLVLGGGLDAGGMVVLAQVPLPDFATGYALVTVGGAVVFLGALVRAILIMCARNHARKRDVPEGEQTGNCCEDFVCGLFCGPCVNCQILHMDGKSYGCCSVCSADVDPSAV